MTDRVFVCVYRMPDKLTNGYCFNGGVPIAFLNVDWFEAAVSEGRGPLVEFIRRKKYFDPKARFLALSFHPEFTFIINGEQSHEL